MNIEHIDPFGQHFPEVIDGKLLDDDPAIICCFSRKGNLLAAGGVRGTCTIWDMDTRGVARKFTGHVQKITAISWDRSGRYVLTGSADWNCIYWDLMDGSRQRTIRFEYPITTAQMHPTKKHIFFAVLQNGSGILVILDEGFKGPIRRLAFPDAFEDPEGLIKAWDEKFVAACSDPTGDRVYIGTLKGTIVVLDTNTLKINTVFRACSTGIRGLRFDVKGRDLVVNANDQKIRVFVVSDEDGVVQFDNEQRFLDSINRSQWAQSCFSADGEYVIGGFSASHSHQIYIWSRHLGSLIKMLQGEKDGLVDVAPHPFKPMLASVGSSGIIYIWSANYVQKYSALAPDFDELEDNEEYVERESEFDEEEDRERKIKEEDTGEEIDVVTITPVNAFDDDSNDPDVFILPVDLSEKQENLEEHDEPEWEWGIAV